MTLDPNRAIQKVVTNWGPARSTGPATNLIQVVDLKEQSPGSCGTSHCRQMMAYAGLAEQWYELLSPFGTVLAELETGIDRMH